MLKSTSSRYSQSVEPQTPYQKAAQAWDERIGSARVQAKSWRLMAFSALALSAGLASALVWTQARGQIVPWIVEIDPRGQIQTVAPATGDYTPSDPQIAFQLSEFISYVRAVPSDPIIMRRNWLKAYDFTNDTGAQALNGYAQANDPFSRTGSEQVDIEVLSVLRASPSSFRVTWLERRYANGQLNQTDRWSSILTITVKPPHDPERLRRNPLGLYITALTWTRELNP
jgi:type IV secretion system protein TrbF